MMLMNYRMIFITNQLSPINYSSHVVFVRSFFNNKSLQKLKCNNLRILRAYHYIIPIILSNYAQLLNTKV